MGEELIIKKQICLIFFVFSVLILSFSLISAIEPKFNGTSITGKIISDKLDSNNEKINQILITGNVVFSSKPNELQEIYSRSLPSITKINIYYTYDVFIPKLNSISFGYNFDYQYPLYEDLNVRMDKNTNGLESFFGDSFWNEFYPGEYYTLDELGEVYTFEYTLSDITKIKEEFYKYQNGSLPTYVGTGFLISSEGYLLTNAHLATLVDSEMEYMEDLIATINYLDYYYTLFYNAVYNEEISQQDYEEYFKKAMYLEENLKISNLKVSKIEVILGDGSDAKKYEAKLIDSNENYLDEIGGRDWALLKIEGNNFPSLALGNSDTVPIGDNIVVIGYPWTSEGTTEEEDNYVSPTPTYGKVSNIVPSGKYKDIQIDISIEGGNSGGPALDQNNQVIGIATSGYNSLGGTYNYLTPINDVTKEIVIIPKQSEIDTLWAEGLENFWDENYATARLKFEEIKSINSDHPYIQEVLKQLDSFSNTDKGTIEANNKKGNNSNSKEKGSVSFVIIIFIILGIIIVFLLSFIILYFFKNNKKRRTKK